MEAVAGLREPILEVMTVEMEMADQLLSEEKKQSRELVGGLSLGYPLSQCQPGLSMRREPE
jgi:hypothetical protein